MDATALSTFAAESATVRQKFNDIRALIGDASLALVRMENALKRMEREAALITPQPRRAEVTNPALERANHFIGQAAEREAERQRALSAEIARIEPVVEVKPEPAPAPKEELVINDEWKGVLDLLNNGDHSVFITGEAGTGKSTLLGYFMEHTSARVAIVAPTGVAALRVGGMTIHRFFHFPAHALTKDDIHLANERDAAKYRNLEILIIDEISMVRADMMDAIDGFMRLNGKDKTKPFGGCRLVMVGDLFQLPPVSKELNEQRYLKDRYGTETPYFFHADVWRDNPIKICELTTVFRQKDPAFTGALNAIRKGAVTPDQMKLLNSRVDFTFKPNGGEPWITLTTTNASVDTANRRMLAAIEVKSRIFEADVIGDFDLKNAPTDQSLELKPGVAVMFIRNSKDGYWVNGTLGKVISTDPLQVEANGEEYDVETETWEQIAYEFDEKKKRLTKQIVGKFMQIPLRLAAAITIHKSQGLTLDRAIIDLAGGTFAAGQLYVGLSRCKSLEGMVLRRAIQDRDLIVSPEVVRFMRGEPVARPQPTLFGTLPERSAAR